MSLIFLMCSERSGSNFISKLLNGHNNICGPSTKHIINPLARNIFRYGDLKDQSNWDELIEDVYRLLVVEFSIWRKKFTLSELKGLAPIGDIKSLIRNIFMEEARINGKQYVFIKENHVYEFLPFLLTYFPESKFIYQVRDPRDMALSWKKNLDHPGGVVNAARQWKKDQQQSLKNFHLLKARGQAVSVKYEDLIANSDIEVKRLLDYLGMSYDENIFDFYKDDITKQNAGMQKAWSNLSKGIISNNSRKYLRELSDEEVKAVEKICWNEMKHLGYVNEYSKEVLDEVSDEWLDFYHNKEILELELIRSEGVIENMKAKSRFYNRY